MNVAFNFAFRYLLHCNSYPNKCISFNLRTTRKVLQFYIKVKDFVLSKL